MFFYIGFSTVLFLIPCGLVAAELGSAFGNKSGGIYAWITCAFGKKFGFATIFLMWIQVMVFYPTGLSFAAAAAANFIGKPHLAVDHVYVGIFCIVAFWVMTGIALVSMQFAAKVTKLGFQIGTAIPGILLIAAFVWWLAAGHPIGWNHASDAAVSKVSDSGIHHSTMAAPHCRPGRVGLPRRDSAQLRRRRIAGRARDRAA